MLIVMLLSSVILVTPASGAAAANAKNVIIMVGDGMGFNDITIADYYQAGKAGVQAYESFPVQIACTTFENEAVSNPYTYPILAPMPSANPDYAIYGYDTSLAWTDFNYVRWTDGTNMAAYNNNSTDSSSAATAIATGVKTKDGYVGVDINKTPQPNITEWADGLGKATGIVSTMSFSHATPAGFAVHQADRNDYASLAKEILYNSALDVVIGCGGPDYDYDGKFVEGPYTAKDARYVGGLEAWADVSDGSVIGADADGDGMRDTWTVIRTLDEFQAMASGQAPNRLLGIPQVKETLQWYRSPAYSAADAYADPLTPGLPTLADLSKAALNVLDNDPDGFFLMIEGGAIDYAGHFNTPGRLIEEMDDFNSAVNAVVAWIEANGGWDETLLIITADHETGYIWGPDSGTDLNDLWKPIVNNGAGVMPGFSFNSDIGGFNWHTNSLVPVFAKGPGADYLKTLAVNTDTKRGSFIDNTDFIKAVKAAYMPAAFTFSSFEIVNSQLNPNDEAVISVVATNTGYSAGDCTVCLKLNGVVEEEKTVSINPGANRFVIFKVNKQDAGIYNASIDGMSNASQTFAVSAPAATETVKVTVTSTPEQITKTNSTLALIIGIVGAVIIIALVILLVRKKN